MARCGWTSVPALRGTETRDVLAVCGLDDCWTSVPALRGTETPL